MRLSGKRGAARHDRHDPAGGALELFPSAAVRGDPRRASGATHNRVVIGAFDNLVVVDAPVLAAATTKSSGYRPGGWAKMPEAARSSTSGRSTGSSA
jgi:hypothetical protein